jgi:hypothetical protein
VRRACVVAAALVTLGAMSSMASAGVYSVGNGETIRASSARYGPEVIEPIVQFIAALPHGHEMSKLSVYVADTKEVTALCGAGGDACYEEEGDRIVIPQELDDGSSMPETIAHEYGHHIVNSRPGNAFGTPRWDIYEHVCELIQDGKLFPENEGRGYWSNPEEAFAQSYAAITVPDIAEEWPFTYWLEPTEAALARIRLDIEHPWPRGYAEARLRRSCHRGTDYYAYY